MAMDVVSFPTKIDRWLVVVLLGALTAMLVSAVAVARTAQTPAQLMAALCTPLLPVGLVALLSWPTRYELHADELVIRSGVIRYRIPYADIRGVAPSRNPLSAPAWSLDRLRIERARGYALISPRDRAGFLEALAARTPQLVREGEQLVARV
jgi:membrane protein YdbS with pleckstrin-like domain